MSHFCYVSFYNYIFWQFLNYTHQYTNYGLKHVFSAEKSARTAKTDAVGYISGEEQAARATSPNPIRAENQSKHTFNVAPN